MHVNNIVGTHEIYNDFLGDLTFGFMPQGGGTLGHRGQNGKIVFTHNLTLGHSWLNFLPSFNFAFGGKRGGSKST